MSYRSIVVHLDGGTRCDARVDLAFRLAAEHDSRLIGVAACGRPDIVLTMSSAVPDRIECVELSATYLRQRALDAARAFEQRCAVAGVRSFEARVVDADAIDALVGNGRRSDLVVVGQSERGGVDGVPRDLPQELVLHGGVPVLIVPRTGTFSHVGRRAVVAWKDCREAARALRDAMPLLRRCERVRLLEVGLAKTSPSSGEGAEAAVAWLATHGVVADRRLETCDGSVGDALIAGAAGFAADLLVMGGYGHSRAREWVLGGATRRLLAHMTVPTLMSH